MSENPAPSSKGLDRFVADFKKAIVILNGNSESITLYNFNIIQISIERKGIKTTEEELFPATPGKRLRFKLYEPPAELGPEDPSYKKIPRFYNPPEKPQTKLAGKLREEARTIMLKQKSQELMDNNELKQFWNLLNEHHTKPVIEGGEMYISFEDFLKIEDHAIMNKVSKFLKKKHFPKLQKSSSLPGMVTIINLFNFVMRKVWVQQTRIGLSLYDPSGMGFLRETDLEAYIFELIPSLTQLDGLEKSFHSFYVCTAVRKFFFFLDPLRTGKIRIKDILKSNFLDELLEVC